MAYSPNHLSQQDPAWKNERLGFSNSKIGPYGCTLTCLTILVNGFGKNETPATLNQKLKGLGRGKGYIDELIVWGGLPGLFPDFRLHKLKVCREDSQRAPLDEIDAALARGQAVLVELDRSPAHGIQNHWVVLYKKEGNDYLMNDPWPCPEKDEPTFLRPRYAFGRSLDEIITAVVWYEKTGIAPPLKNGFFVRVQQSAGSGLRMRSQPTTDSDTLTVLAAGAYLRVLDEEADARAKIGVTGKWLHVRNLAGTEGYIAAWFVETVENTGSEGNGEEASDDDALIQDPLDEEVIDDSNDDPAPPPDDEPTAQVLKVYVSKVVGERGMRMRAQPGLSGTLQTTLSQSAELTVLEVADIARTKVGVAGQWLHVEAGAHKGYVAAWLLTLDPNEIIEEEPADDPQDDPMDLPDDDDVPSDAEPVVSPGLKLYVAGDVGSRGLRMRAQPSLGGSLITTLSQHAELRSLEADDETRAKVGVSGQWLRIKTGTYEGYVAAWLVTFDLTKTPVVEDAPVEELQDEPVEASSDEEPTPTALTVTVFPSLGRNGLRMRARPGLGGSLVSVLQGGTKLTVITNEPTFDATKVGIYGQWLRVRTHEGREGYVAAWYVKLDENVAVAPAPDTLIVYVTSLARGGLRMRKGPSTGYAIVKTLKANSALTVVENEEEAIAKIGATGQWLHVHDENGIEGYVAAWYIVR